MIEIEKGAETNDEKPLDEENREEKIAEIEIESLLDLSNLSDFDDNSKDKANGGSSDGTHKSYVGDKSDENSESKDGDWGDDGDKVEDEVFVLVKQFNFCIIINLGLLQ